MGFFYAAGHVRSFSIATFRNFRGKLEISTWNLAEFHGIILPSLWFGRRRTRAYFQSIKVYILEIPCLRKMFKSHKQVRVEGKRLVTFFQFYFGP